jgi:hypothetical protein
MQIKAITLSEDEVAKLGERLKKKQLTDQDYELLEGPCEINIYFS